MDLNVSVKTNYSGSFTACQMEEIASALKITLPDNMRLVYYGQMPPLDTTLTWQPTNGIGDPVGKVKVFKEGAWNE